MLITIVSLSLCSNKLGNNFDCDTNLMMLMFSLLISNKKVLSCNWLGTNKKAVAQTCSVKKVFLEISQNLQENTCEFYEVSKNTLFYRTPPLFEQMRFSFDNLTHVVFWTKVELFYKTQLKRSVLKSPFQNPRNLDEKKLFFHHSQKNNSKFTTGQKID